MEDRLPWFPFYVLDFSGDPVVEAMTTEEVGAYALLLCKAWHQSPPGSIPNDDRTLAKWTRLSSDGWSECRTGVLAAFKLGSDGRWHQKRMRQEYERQRKEQAKREDAAKIAANTRWGKHRCVTHASRIRDGCQSESDINSPRARDPAQEMDWELSGLAQHLSTDAFRSLLASFVIHLREKGEDPTPSSWRAQLAHLATLTLADATEAVNYSLRNGYAGIHIPSGRKGRKAGSKVVNQPLTGVVKDEP